MPAMLRTIAFLLLASFGTAAAAESFDIAAPIAGQTGKTWFDIAKIIVPDLHWQGERAVGASSIPLRNLDPADDEIARPEAQFVILSVQVEEIEAEGRRLTLASFGLGPADGWAIGIEALALFDENFVLLDAINIGQDQFTELRGSPIRIARDSEAVLSYSEHFNSNQTYGHYALIMVKDGRLETIDTIGVLSDRWCGHERTQSLDASAADAGAGYWPITVTVTDVLTTEGQGECGEDAADEEPFENTVSATYNWSASMGFYVADREALDQLAEVNRNRY